MNATQPQSQHPPPLPFRDIITGVYDVQRHREDAWWSSMLEPQHRVASYPVYDAYNDPDTYYWNVVVQVPAELFARFDNEKERKEIEKEVSELASHIGKAFGPRPIYVEFVPALRVLGDPKANGITNQGRARPDSIPGLQVNGVLYRSELERRLAHAFLTLNFVVKPLPLVLFRVGDRLRRVEPDIEVIVQGRSVVVEVDGPSHTESPADAAARLERLRSEGVTIERVRWQDCDTDAKAMETAKQLAAKWAMAWRH